jgi:hypothetical protein
MREYIRSKSVFIVFLVILFPFIFYFTESDGCVDLGGVWNWATLSCEDKGVSHFVPFTQKVFHHQLFSVCIVLLLDVVLSYSILFPFVQILKWTKRNRGKENKVAIPWN